MMGVMRCRRPRRSAAFLAVVVVVLAAVAACGGGGGGGGGPRTAAAGTLNWHSCGSGFNKRDQCATLPVPLDRSAPSNGTIDLALIRAKATGSDRLGSLLINPGGPGASTIDEFDVLASELASTLRKHFDIVGFDPRGVGRSNPVTCTNTAGLDAYTALNLAPTTAAGVAALEAGARRLADACVAQSGPLLAHVGTKDAAEDMDAIRVAVGDAKLTYLGYSYGTFLGAEYAALFPTHVRALVLDGALDPAEPAVTGSNAQSKGFQAQLDAFLTDCKTSGDCRWKIAGDPHHALRALVAKVAARPLPAGHGRELYAGELFRGIGVTLYDQRSWPDLSAALAGVAAGNGSAMLKLSDDYTDRTSTGYDNSIEANLAVNCRDYAWPRDPAVFVADARAAATVAPDFGTANLDLELACAYWPASASGTGTRGPFTAPGSPPILVVATTGDPATPYSEGVSLAKQLSRGVLLTNVGEQHTAYPYSSCVRKYADSYLVSLEVPAVGSRCDDE
jgi:pimeloyl-ACP methyl ester carboxylesterase